MLEAILVWQASHKKINYFIWTLHEWILSFGRLLQISGATGKFTMFLFFLGITEYFKEAQFSSAVEEFELCYSSHTLQSIHWTYMTEPSRCVFMMIGSCYFSRCAPAFLQGWLREPAQNKCYSVRPSLARGHCVSTRKDLVFISPKWGSLLASFVNFGKKWVIPWWFHQIPKQPSSSILEGLACKFAERAPLKTESPGRSAHLETVGQQGKST